MCDPEAVRDGNTAVLPRLGPNSQTSGSMSSERLKILFVSHMPASPPRCGAQARVHGLMTQLGRHHDLTAVMLIDDEFDLEECRLAIQAYCRGVVLVQNPYGRNGYAKRLLQA